MTEKPLLVLSSQTDPLWQNYLPPHSFRFDAGRGRKPEGYPHICNIMGWRRWLKRNCIREVHLYQPDPELFPLLAAVSLLPISVTIHITGSLEIHRLRSIKWLAPRMARFSCAGNFLVEALKRIGIPPHRITLDWPIPAIQTISDAARSDLRRQITAVGGSDSDPFLVLALPVPGNTHALRTVCWACAVLYHLGKNIKLIAAGPCGQREEERLESWQRMWKVHQMIIPDRQQHDWDSLVAACDAVLASGQNLREVIRLLHVQAAGQKMVTQSGDGSEFLQESARTKIVAEPGARPLAAALLSMLEPAGKA
ncbi:MAG: hypothetical protein BWY71_00163 [Planctomycetes bacterium ADurb.Bin412]|nr:MAG: hypothetical protein BWY71_00163 [Planctomycetes bacterium ADurb.Bin412]